MIKLACLPAFLLAAGNAHAQIYLDGPTPHIAAGTCGTNAVIIGTDISGLLNTGTSPIAQSCTLVFATPWKGRGVSCVVVDSRGMGLVAWNGTGSDNTRLIINGLQATGPQFLQYRCAGFL